MKIYIKEHFKVILAITIMLFAACALIVSNEIRAQMLPIASEELTFVYCEIDKEVCEYSGNPIKNDIHRLVFSDKDGNRIVMYRDDFKIINYIDNIEIGQADIEISVNGYQETIIIEDAFAIQPARGAKPQITNATRTFTDLMWDEVPGADGYLLYKSKDDGQTYMPIKDSKSGKALVYTDKDVALNEVYLYYVKAYKQLDNGFVFGEPSETIKRYTPLDNPVVTAVKDVEHDTLKVEWTIVDGAAGYQVYRSDKQDGEYTLLAEIADGMAMSYKDTTCECAKPYYYYIKACQQTDAETLWGEASAIVSGKTTPETIVTNYSTGVSGDLSSVTQYQGVPYVGGGTTPKGWDCSGFTQWVMKNYYGVSLAKSAAEQSRGGKTVSVSDRASWQPGDILCYTKGGRSKTVTHVALYLGNGKMIHALSEKHDTIIHDVDFYETWDSHTKLYTVKRYY